MFPLSSLNAAFQRDGGRPPSPLSSLLIISLLSGPPLCGCLPVPFLASPENDDIPASFLGSATVPFQCVEKGVHATSCLPPLIEKNKGKCCCDPSIESDWKCDGSPSQHCTFSCCRREVPLCGSQCCGPGTHGEAHKCGRTLMPPFNVTVPKKSEKTHWFPKQSRQPCCSGSQKSAEAQEKLRCCIRDVGIDCRKVPSPEEKETGMGSLELQPCCVDNNVDYDDFPPWPSQYCRQLTDKITPQEACAEYRSSWVGWFDFLHFFRLYWTAVKRKTKCWAKHSKDECRPFPYMSWFVGFTVTVVLLSVALVCGVCWWCRWLRNRPAYIRRKRLKKILDVQCVQTETIESIHELKGERLAVFRGLLHLCTRLVWDPDFRSGTCIVLCDHTVRGSRRLPSPFVTFEDETRQAGHHLDLTKWNDRETFEQLRALCTRPRAVVAGWDGQVVGVRQLRSYRDESLGSSDGVFSPGSGTDRGVRHDAAEQ
uniref:Uncharacterized protein n=1 Tax=Chromera velia CCMP2878 TaxID=1169474 RepID=A0A0G4FHK9_9ALVE|eukprot:Cvel_17046.t1-p1 / transcript=Cvel_17046.t1 / gene=Cvel_17046 / organism=Chromera_velia_CCMP2878 / gene_product=hypothetical protein / transcript_product=hypothetical protein / location=Cvel_scaffold1342:14566-16008(-) / protein_length=481 / sequence_SO=supercontig / SO=protein_coding / is_pseudo=false